MGILEHVSGLEDMMSKMEEEDKPLHKPKSKMPETDKGAKSDSRLEKIEDSIRSLEEAVEDIRNIASKAPSAETQPSSETIEKLQDDMKTLQETVRNLEKGGGKSNLQDILRRLDETDRRIDETYAAAGEKIKNMEKMQNGEKRGFFGLKPDSEKRIDEAIKRMDKNSEIIGKKQEEIRMEIEERINRFEETAKSSRENNYSGDIESLKKTLAKIMADLKNADSRISGVENIRGEQSGMKESVMNDIRNSMQRSMNGFKSGIDRHIGDAVKKMDETAIRIGKEQESIRKDVNERLNAAIKHADERAGSETGELSKKIDGIFARVPEMIRPLMEEDKKINERLKVMEDRANSLRNDAAKMLSEALRNIPKRDEIKKDIEERAGAIESGLEEKAGNKLSELNSGIEKFWKDAETSKRQMVERMKDFAGRVELEKSLTEMKAAEKRINEKIESIKKESDAFASKSDIDRLNIAVGGRLNEFSRKIGFVSRFDLDKINSLANAEKKIDENLRLFALNSDVEKIWKETESLKRYVDEKNRMADSLANSLRIWEARNMQLMEKEHDINERLSAFPELKMMEGRIRRLERVLVELQKHFVAAQITEPIIME